MSAEEAKQKEHERWIKFADNYAATVVDRHSLHQIYDHIVNELAHTLKTVDGGAHILDVASASGEPAVSFAKVLSNAKIISTDFSESYIPLGRAYAERNGISSDVVSFETADGENLHQFTDASFDAVTCSLGLMFMPTYTNALKEFKRVLKPQTGLCAVSFWGKLENVPLFNMLLQYCSELDPVSVPSSAPNTACRLSREEVTEAMTAAGFSNLEYAALDITFTFASESWFEDMIKMPFPLGPLLNKKKEEGNENAMEEGKAELLARFLEKGYVMDDGKIAVNGNLCHFLKGSA